MNTTTVPAPLSRIKSHPLYLELVLCMRRMAIAWRLWRLNVQERRAAIELAYERAREKRLAENFRALREDNAERRKQYRKQLEQLMEGSGNAN